MSTIFLDPIQMDATAGHVGEHVNQLTTLTADLETACSAVVPASIAGWLAEELRDITVTVRMIALLYSVAALDTAQRAQQIQADQSLATAAPSLASTSPTFTGAPLIGGFSPFASSSMAAGTDVTAGSPLVGGFGAYGSSVTGASFAAGSPLVGGFFLGAPPSAGAASHAGLSSEAFAAQNAPWGSRGLSSALFGSGRGSSGLPIFDMPGYHEGNLWTLSDERTGTTYISPGIYERGGQIGDWNSLPEPDEG